MKSLRFLPAVILTIVAMAACTSIDCSIDNVVACQWQLRKGSGLDTLKTDTLTISATRASGQDTIIFNRGTGISSFSLPMSYSADADVLLLQLADTAGNSWTDIVSIAKTNQPHMESVDCTPQFHHTITGVSHTTNIIDSVVINHPNVTNDATQQNLYLYLRSR